MAKVLIVEDDPLMSRMYQKIFTFEKFEVEVANDGLEGFEKVKLTKPTIVLLDVMMPKMNGLQVLEKLKLDPETKSIPVIMLTNLASEKDAETALMKGAIKYIVKSQYEPKQVVQIVEEIIAATTRDQVPMAAQMNDTPSFSSTPPVSATPLPASPPVVLAVVEPSLSSATSDSVSQTQQYMPPQVSSENKSA